MTGKHRDHLVEAIHALAHNIEDNEWAGLDVVAVLGMRDPVTDDVTFYVRVNDPARRLYGAGIEGMAQLGPNEFTFSKAEAAEHLATLLAQDAINFAKAAQP
ncbi:MAG: hypothetical protein M3619_00825 [Myxococcota bacterium]|nr:hypothetical protein [Myxococcota bacterium]